MSGLRKFMFVAALVLCLLLSWANAEASQVLDENADQATELNNQAVVFVKDNHYEEALELLKKATRLKPDFSEAYNNLGVSYFKMGQVSGAIESLQRAIRLRPDLAVAHYNLGVIYFERGQRSLALEQYHLLKSIDYEMAQKLFDAIFQDKILKIREQSRE